MLYKEIKRLEKRLKQRYSITKYKSLLLKHKSKKLKKSNVELLEHVADMEQQLTEYRTNVEMYQRKLYVLYKENNEIKSMKSNHLFETLFNVVVITVINYMLMTLLGRDNEACLLTTVNILYMSIMIYFMN